MTSTETGAAQQLGRIIERCRREIERRWLERVENAAAGRPGIELTHLRDGLPDYLIELVRLFSQGGTQNFSASEATKQNASEPAQVALGADAHLLGPIDELGRAPAGQHDEG